MAFFGHRWQIHRAAVTVARHLIRTAERHRSYREALEAIHGDVEAWRTADALARLRALQVRVAADRATGKLDGALADELTGFGARLSELLESA